MDTELPGGGTGWSALLQRAQAAGLHSNMELVSLEPGRIADAARPCLPYLDSIVINELGAGALTGIDTSVPAADGPVDWPALEAMAVGLIKRGVSVLAVVHFPAGCVAAAPGGSHLAAGLRPAAARAGPQRGGRGRRLRRRHHPGPA